MRGRYAFRLVRSTESGANEPMARGKLLNADSRYLFIYPRRPHSDAGSFEAGEVEGEDVFGRGVVAACCRFGFRLRSVGVR